MFQVWSRECDFLELTVHSSLLSCLRHYFEEHKKITPKGLVLPPLVCSLFSKGFNKFAPKKENI